MSAPAAPPMAGLGLKPAHVADVLANGSALDFFEVHAENCMVAGGPALRRLERVRERHALSLHGVGLSIGGPGPLDAAHLARLGSLVRRFEPRWVSEHLAWSRHGPSCLGDLLPLPYTAATLRQVCRNVDQLQEALGLRILLENPSTYLAFAESTMDEAAFLCEVQRRCGCGLLLDVNNAYVSAVNHGRDAWTFIEALPLRAVGEIHLAGFAEDRDAAGERLLIDHHGSPVDDAVWALYRRTLSLTGPLPTLIERDHALPPFAVLQAEALRAREAQRASLPARAPGHGVAPAAPLPGTRSAVDTEQPA